MGAVLMGNWIALVTLGCFCVLASYSYGAQMGRLHRPAVMVAVWGDARAAQIADIYGVTPDEVDKPIKIFGE
jgi:hypothetical protein